MHRSVAIVRYNAGNTRSVLCALHRLGYDGIVTDDPVRLAKASRVIFPGVGEASSAMKHIIGNRLSDTIATLRQPFLGICLGMQLMCSHSEEQDTQCLRIFDTHVKKFPKAYMKIPHMGWNTLSSNSLPISADQTLLPWCYFVHSFYVPLCDQTIAACDYGNIAFSAALGKNNYFGLQFHPEKSGQYGTLLLRSFIEEDWMGRY